MSSMCMSYLDDSLLVSTWQVLSFPLSLLPLSHHLSARKKEEKHYIMLVKLNLLSTCCIYHRMILHGSEMLLFVAFI